MPDATIVADRKERGVCIACGKRPARKKPPAFKCQPCISLASEQKISAQKQDPESHAAAQRADRARRKKFGICSRCDAVVAPNKSKCEQHLAETRASVARSKKPKG